MNLKYFFTDILNIGQPAKRRPKVTVNKVVIGRRNSVRRKAGNFVDLENLQGSSRLSQEEIQERIRKGRVAEMSLYHAGLK